MAEDKDEDKSAADSSGDSGEDAQTGKLGKILKLLLPVGIIVLFAAGGYFASRLNTPAEASAEDGEPTTMPEKPPTGGEDPELTYFDLEPIVVNLNEPQVTRYLRALFSLGIADDDFGTAKEVIEKKMYDLNNWLIVYLSDLSIEDVRGAKNINRVRREIQDSINDRLWPGERPLVLNVSLKEWIIQ
jgi:flagellar basal body-associated protein FliL